MFSGGGDDCLVAEMHAIEYADRQEEWSWQARELWDRA